MRTINRNRLLMGAAIALPVLIMAASAWAQTAAPAAAPAAAAAAAAAPAPPPKMDSGDTAWMLASTALVLMMTIPGLALFYAGMVRKKNILATMMQSFTVCCVVTIAWMVVGYSLAFTSGTPYIGDLSRFFLNGMGATWDKPFALGGTPADDDPRDRLHDVPDDVRDHHAGTDRRSVRGPSEVQRSADLHDAVVRAGLLADRSLGLDATGWLGAGVFGLPGAADFAGGTVVHINAGIAGLMCALVLGKRVGYGQDNMAPYNTAYAVIGASLLWVGWFGFNAGSAVAANGRAGMAMAVTQIATAAAALAWAFAEWAAKGKPSVLGAASGAVAGLVAITPASGFVLPGPALLIGIAAGVGCFWSATSLKHMLGYDDSLDAFGVHGIGGIIGALLTGVFAFGPLSGGANVGGLPQFGAQCIAVATTLIYSGGMTLIILMITKALVGLRVGEEEEREGLDLVLHGEQIF